uniref:RZ-type domain-containing protein n=1 Tax=Macrostomum lignano TaxID=282301 RepID=A0A1I8G8T5_9PLAT
LFRTAYKRLPQFEDVLLCHDGTSEEELAVFLHRALLDPSGDSVYTILNAEQLTYKISVVAEEMFSKLIDSVDGTVNSRFFVFVSSANQSQFPFCNYLRPYEQDFPMEPDAEKIKKFSQKTLQKAEPKNSDFLWITSSRSGMGKSLVCEHFAWSKEESVPAVFACNTDHLCVDELLTAAEQYFPGFRKFVVDCLLLMSKDFSTRSLDIDDESERRHDDGRSQPICEIESFQLKRHWEQESHPLLLFNQDSDSFTFIGFKIDANGNLVDLNTGKILKKGIMSKQLRQSLLNQGVPLDDDFEELEQCEKIIRIRNVFGFNDSNENLETLPEFDSSYELTMDNVKKILAIYMRFRCKIPVVIMGETGCGKTKLVDFLAKIMRPLRNDIDNIRILKVHGGITAGDIEQAVSEAEVLAEKNFSVLGNKSPYTVLFFDEINTTSYVGLIKEIMMDGRIKGRRIDFEHGLRCVAACNPYRKHSEETIKRLESSGLGYRVRKEETVDKFGNIPMRCLVYRVKPLPLSLISVLWDFGNLSEDAEQFQSRLLCNGKDLLPDYVANNEALRENVYMMTMCICLRIPLFVVGKPGSSKSLGKTIVKNNMKGENSRGSAFKKLPDTHMLSFQCSPWSTSDGIEKLFQQSAKMQIEKSDPENYVSVVVLDEIGLAEDTPQMSLKVLHSLLEDGVRMDSDGGPSLPGLGHERVGFIGISNWALDPAKMNRGLFVLRDVPTKTDLLKTAKGICKDTIVQASKNLRNLTDFFHLLFNEDFRIIVIADGKTVQDLFPIPLLNRLEKHRLTWRTILEPDMLGFCEKFKEWMNRFLSQEEKGDSALSWSFVGYHDDVIPSLAIDENCDFDSVKRRVLSTATPDSLIRLASTSLRDEKAGILNSYYEENGLGCLASFLNNYKLKKPFLQVTTYDSILGANQQATLSQMPIFKGATYKNISQFETELQFKEFLRKCMTSEGLLILQYEGLQQNQNFQKVVSSVKFNIEEMYLAEKRNMEPTSGKTSNEDFLQTVRVFLHKALRTMDENSRSIISPENWLSEDAASSRKVKEAGTFIESTWRLLRRKTAPALASFIAFADTDENLANYQREETRALWLKLAPHAAMFDETIENFVKVGPVEQARVEVPSSAADGHHFASQFPFSWAIVKRLEKFEEQSNAGNLSIRDSPMGQALAEEKSSDFLLEAFCHDILHICVSSITSSDVVALQAVLQETVKSVLKEQRKEQTLADTILQAFKSLKKHIEQVNIFVKLTQRIGDLAKNLKKVENFQDLPSELFNAFAKHFEKSRHELNKAQKRKEWLSRVDKSRTIIVRLLAELENPQMQLQWDKINCVALFLRNVTMPFDNEELNESTIKPIRLWNSLWSSAAVKFQDKTGIEEIEKFLEKNREELLEFSMGTDTCSQCTNRTDSLTRLPCNDRLCDQCRDKCIQSAPFVCIKCQTPFDPNTINNEKPDVLVKFKDRCNSFVMEVVSTLCFVEGQPPDSELCNHLLSYVTRSGGDGNVMGYFSNDKDESPMFRSFVLQQLMRYNSDQVVQRLEEHILGADEKVGAESKSELRLILLNCLEDSVAMEQAKNKVVNLSMPRVELPNSESVETVLIPQLQAMAEWRVDLLRLACRLAELATEGTVRNLLSTDDATILIRTLSEHRWSRIYFLRCLCMAGGTCATLQRIQTDPCLAEAYNNELHQMDNGTWAPDLLHSHSEAYRGLKQYLWNLYLTGDFKSETPSAVRDSNAVIALVVATFNFRLQGEVNKKKLSECEKHMLKLMSKGTRECYAQLERLGKTKENEAHKSVLLIHLAYEIHSSSRNSIYAKFLSSLRQNYEKWYLPAMPHDTLFEVMTNVDIGMSKTAAFQCPKGHLYFVGECKLPMETSACPDCGSKIGGTHHRPEDGNEQYTAGDRTSKGFVSTGIPEPVRNLPSCGVALMRMMMGLALQLGNDSNSETGSRKHFKDVGREEFEVGLHLFCDATGRSSEDAFHALHLVLKRLATAGASQSVNRNFDLTKDKDRREFEDEIYRNLLQPIVESLSSELRESNRVMSQDDGARTASNIMRLVHETSSEMEPRQEIGLLWRYRQQISIRSAAHSFTELGGEEQGRYQLVKEVIARQHILKHVRHLPVLVKLAKELVSEWKHNRELKEAKKMKLRNVGQYKTRRSEAVKIFVEVWNELHELLADRAARFLQQKQDGWSWIAFPVEKWSIRFDSQTPSAALLPHRKPWGRCIVGLIQLLVDAHNAVIDACENSEPDTVKIGLIDEASVFVCDPDRDLQPMLLANSSYSLKQGASTEVTYNFLGLQQQLRERLVRGRPRICGYLPEMVYNEDFNLMEIFKQLDRFGVKQTEQKDNVLENALQCNLPTPILTALLDDSLKVVINFLISLTPSNPSQLLDDFMQNTLHMDSGLPTDALKRQVTIAHTRLLWMSLDHLRWKQLAQDGFEPYDTEQAEPLSQEQLQELPPGLKNKRSLLLEMLHRLIRLELRSLPTSLQEHPLNQMADFDAVYEVAFQDLPSSLEGKHACSLWSVVFAWANE